MRRAYAHYIISKNAIFFSMYSSKRKVNKHFQHMNKDTLMSYEKETRASSLTQTM